MFHSSCTIILSTLGRARHSCWCQPQLFLFLFSTLLLLIFFLICKISIPVPPPTPPPPTLAPPAPGVAARPGLNNKQTSLLRDSDSPYLPLMVLKEVVTAAQGQMTRSRLSIGTNEWVNRREERERGGRAARTDFTLRLQLNVSFKERRFLPEKKERNRNSSAF